jgi:hypothetical protein
VTVVATDDRERTLIWGSKIDVEATIEEIRRFFKTFVNEAAGNFKFTIIMFRYLLEISLQTKIYDRYVPINR